MSSVKTTVCSLLLALALAGALSAQQHPSHERGFDPEKLYQFSDLDSVNLLNGNLTLAIPIGMRYPVGGGLTYGLTLTYNAKAWDHQEVSYQGNPKSQALPGRLANAGLGWTLAMGRLLAPEDAINDYDERRWAYIGPDGAEHIFYAALHGNDPPTGELCSSLCYTRDGSYLRLRVVHSGLRVVEFPDGQQHHFMLVYFNGLPAWRLAEIRDRFEDGERDVEIFYLDEDFLWEIWDKHGRRHRVVFEPDPAGGGKPRLQRVEFSLNAVDIPAATYLFSYLPVQWIDVPCSHTYPGGKLVQVSLLSSLFLPDGPSNGASADGSSYGFQHYYGAASSGTCYARGVLSDVILPTLGKLHYTYRQHTLPITGCSYQEWHSHSGAIATRQFLGASGEDLGTWTYTATLSDPPDLGSISCEPLTPKAYSPPSEQLKVEIVTPLKDRSTHFFSVYPGAEPGFPRSTTSSELDYGLSIGRIAPAGPDNTGTRHLSTQVSDCDAAGLNCQARRSQYARYERDSAVACSGQLSVGCMNSNRRLASERTVYHDDADRFADLDSSDFDDFGHYRTVAARGSFPADWRTSFTHYNPGNVLPGSAWLLNTYTEQTVEEDGLKAKVQVCFDSATGFLKRQRTLAQTNASPGPLANDVLVVYTPDPNGSGDVTREDWYGGDVQALSTAAGLCTLQLPAATQYAMAHTYQSGSLATSQYRDVNNQATGSLAFFTVNRSIDARTGLVAASTDPAGLTTTYVYDALGRLTTVEPVGTVNDALTTYAYCTASSDPACGAKAEVVVARKTAVNGAEITALRYRFDALGRLISEEERMPPTGTYQARTFAYNGLGWRTFVSEKGAPGGTSYLNHDPFGRPGIIRPADGTTHDVTMSYLGARQVQRTVKVSLNPSAQETPATTTEVYDRNGRLVEVTEPNGVKTRYDYDVGNRLKKVCQNATGSGTDTCGQARHFTYDNRGFLLSEQHPEKGAGGNGIVSYSNYNARGRAEQRLDGANDLTFSYDRAERLAQVRETTGLQRTLKSFTYGTGATAEGAS
ncbi:MAG: RHS repeat domain-containing protein, partial [Anaerolineales bacterium]